MPTTPVLALPYPVTTDTADVPRDIQALAVKLDGMTTLRPPVVTSLPGSPVDGQECYYVANATAGLVWHLRYRAASTSPYKWEVIGGSGLHAEIAAGEQTTSAGYTALPTPGPDLVIPLAGDYDVLTSTEMSGNASIGVMSYQIGATAAADADMIIAGIIGAFAWEGYPSRTKRRTFTTAGVGVSARYRTNSVNVIFTNRLLRATPVRVG